MDDQQQVTNIPVGENGARGIIVRMGEWFVNNNWWLIGSFTAGAIIGIAIGYVAFVWQRVDSQILILISALAGVVFAGWSALTAARQLKINTRFAALKLVSDTFDKIAADKEVVDLVEKIDGEKELEVQALVPKTIATLNRLLAYLAIIEYARKQGLVSDDDLGVIQDNFLQIMNKAVVKDHLEHLAWMKKQEPELRDGKLHKALEGMADHFSPDEKK